MSPTRYLTPALLMLLIGVPTSGVASSSLLAYLTMSQEAKGFSNSFIGLGHALHIGAVAIIAPLMPWLMQKGGPVRLLLINNTLLMLSLAGVYISMQSPDPSFWQLVSRLGFGLLLGGHYLIGESWLNHLASPEHRGRILGIYGSLLGIALGTGPLIVAGLGLEAASRFIWPFSAAVYALATVLILSQHRTAPLPPVLPLGFLLKQLFHWPTILACLLAYGALESTFITMLPLHALAGGYARPEALWLVTIGCSGAIAMQWVIGWLTDHYPRKQVLLGACIGSLAGSGLLYLCLPFYGWLQVSVFCWAGIFSALYTVPYVMLAERMAGVNIAVASASALLMYGCGSLIGPAVIGLGMDWQPVLGYPLVTGTIALGCFLIVALRLHSRVQPMDQADT